MAGIKSLAKDTAIYGMSSIIGKFLNWCLTPLYTYLLVPAEYGIVVYLYARIGTMLVLLTYGLETGFFRYANDSSKGDPQTVYSTCMTSLGITTCLFLILVFSFLSPISGALQYGQHQDYIGMIAIIIALDVFSALPFAYLRYRLRPLRFAFLKLLNIALTIIFNLFFLVVCPVIYKNHPDLISWFYRPDYGAGYILVSNVIASFVLLLLLTPEIFRIRWHFDWRLLKEILRCRKAGDRLSGSLRLSEYCAPRCDLKGQGCRTCQKGRLSGYAGSKPYCFSGGTDRRVCWFHHTGRQ